MTKVHVQARRYAADGYTVILIGHAGHEEVVGTMGEIPDSIVLVESTEEVDGARPSRPDAKLAYVTQTTLSVDETGDVITALRERFPAIRAPQTRGHLLRDLEPAVGRQGAARPRSTCCS